jgi:hypothetical protein
MKKLGLLLVFAASLTFAVEAAHPGRPAPLRAKMACADTLRPQMEADNTVAFQLKTSAYTNGLEQGIELGAGGMLLIVGLVSLAGKIKPKSATQKLLSRAASA